MSTLFDPVENHDRNHDWMSFLNVSFLSYLYVVYRPIQEMYNIVCTYNVSNEYKTPFSTTDHHWAAPLPTDLSAKRKSTSVVSHLNIMHLPSAVFLQTSFSHSGSESRIECLLRMSITSYRTTWFINEYPCVLLHLTEYMLSRDRYHIWQSRMCQTPLLLQWPLLGGAVSK
jgi:hypothetical protein